MTASKVKDIMTRDPVSATPDTDLRTIAGLMCEKDCGEIPIVESKEEPRPVGVITDRDITCRSVAQGKNPLELKARDCMSRSPVTVTPETSIDECCRVMETRQIRRVPVVDRDGKLCGMVAQADIARGGTARKAAEVVKRVSEPAHA